MTYTIKLRRGLSSDWTVVNPILAEGEFGYELDTRNFKIGDGSTTWNLLEYVIDTNDRLPDASGLTDNQILLSFGGEWTVVELPSSLPNPAGLPDGKILTVVSENWVVGDPSAGGGTTLHRSASWNVVTAGQDRIELAAVPYQESLQIFKNGILLRPGAGNDYTVVDETTVIFVNLPTAGDLISDHYWTVTEAPGESVLASPPVAEVIPGSLINLNYDYQHDFVLPTGIQANDLMLVAWNNWHPWGVNTVDGWISDYEPGGTTVVCHKFIDTEIAGETVLPSNAGSGYRAAGQMVIVRGADLVSPIYQLSVAGADISTGANPRRVIHMVEQGGGGANPTLSRGAEIQAAYDGTVGVRASEENVPASTTVACSTNVGFLASIAIKAV